MTATASERDDPLRIRALGVDLDLHLSGLDPTEVRRISHSWAWCRPATVRPERSEPDVVITAGIRGVGMDVDASSAVELADRLSSTATVAALGHRRRDLLMLHAAAVADPATGAVVALVGPSGRGKTTACQALGRHFGYVTDEATGIADDLTVVPYPKPLSVKARGTAPFKRQDHPGDAGLLRAPGTLHLAGVVLLDRTDLPPDVPATVHETTFADSVADLVSQVSYLRERPAPLRRLAGLLDAAGGIHRVTYGDAGTLVPVVRGLLRASVRRGPPTSPPYQVPPGDAAVVAPGPGRIGHGGVLDVLELPDGGVAVLTSDATVRVLRGIGPAILAATRRPATASEVVTAVLTAHGAPPGGSARDVVEAAVAELVAGDVLRRA